MPLNTYIPFINPLHITEDGYSPSAQYNSKNIKDYQLPQTIKSWFQQAEWYQPWQRNDTMKFQFNSQMGPVEAKIYDVYENLCGQFSFTQMQQSYFDSTMYIYQASFTVSTLPAGYYYMKFEFGNPVNLTLVSNIFHVEGKFDESVLIEYSHYKHYADAYFENGWNPSIRLYGNIVYEKPGSKNTIYENQESDMTLLDSKPFDIWRLYTGGPEGIPDWAIMKYNIIAGCSNFKADGRYYTKATEGAAFEMREERDYPLRGWSIELRDKLNRASKIWNNTGQQNILGLTVAVNVETKGFVNNDQGGSYNEVLDVE